MPTPDDAAYKRRYDEMRSVLSGFDHDVIACRIDIALNIGKLNVWVEGNLDAYTDILMERGLCSSVLGWCERPARPAAPPAPPEPPEWDGEIPW